MFGQPVFRTQIYNYNMVALGRDVMDAKGVIDLLSLRRDILIYMNEVKTTKR